MSDANDYVAFFDHKWTCETVPGASRPWRWQVACNDVHVGTISTMGSQFLDANNDYDAFDLAGEQLPIREYPGASTYTNALLAISKAMGQR